MHTHSLGAEFKDLGVGLGLRPVHYPHISLERPETAWFEAISENYFGPDRTAGGPPLRFLDRLRRERPVVLHGVSLSIGSTDPLDRSYLDRLERLAHRIEPAWISDHLCFTGVEGENLHDLLPLPYTEEALVHLTERIAEAQDTLGRRILLENVSSYVEYAHSTLSEWEFLSELSRRADCGLLVDLNNIYVNSVNHAFDPVAFVRALPADRIGQIHLGGHSAYDDFCVDTHDHPVHDDVWSLYRTATRAWGEVSTLIEWDAKIPEYAVLEAEARKALTIRDEVRIERAERGEIVRAENR